MPPPVFYQPPPPQQQYQSQPLALPSSTSNQQLNRIENLLTYGLTPVANTSDNFAESLHRQQQTANRFETIYEPETPIRNSLFNPMFKNQLFTGNPLAYAINKEKVNDDIDEIKRIEWLDIDEDEEDNPQEANKDDKNNNEEGTVEQTSDERQIKEENVETPKEKKKYKKKVKVDYQEIALENGINIVNESTGKEKTILELKRDIDAKFYGQEIKKMNLRSKKNSSVAKSNEI